MCGIVGYVGSKDVIPLLIGGLEKLEYRGYDSAGVATMSGESFEVHRSQGKLANLKSVLADKAPSQEGNGTVRTGIGHTRWATHGKPSETNAHPHVAGKVCVVHNGIIENYSSLRTRLQQAGCVFDSETDTEIAAHLINSYLEEKGSLLEAVRAATLELQGSYALVVMAISDPNTLIVAKNSTPVIIGLAENEKFVASDIPAILEHTRQILILEDEEIAEVKLDSVQIETAGKPVERKPINVTWDPITAEKGGYRHFMLKEIHEQPGVLTDTFRGRINPQEASVFLDDVELTDKDLQSIERVCIVACGTALHAGLVTKFFIEQFSGMHVEVDYGSEYRYRETRVDSKTLFVAISQSGETIDTLVSLERAVKGGAKTMAICNVVGSSIARKAGNVLYTHAGPEISVASTKAFTTQLVGGYLLALRLAAARGTLDAAQTKAAIEDLIHLPSHVQSALDRDRQIEKIARKYGRAHDWLFLGRGMLYPIALEGALKLKEISYLHAEGYPAGEMKHGPISLITEETPVVIVFGRDGVNYEKAMSNLMEVESRGGRIIAVTDQAEPELKDLAFEIIDVGEVPRRILPIVLTIPLQLLAYHVAVYRGTDIDQPRNLAKSVTVE